MMDMTYCIQSDQESSGRHNDSLNNDIIDNRCGSDDNACLARKVNENIDIIVLYCRLKNCYVQGNMPPELTRGN